jgi:Flp pilus assembly protein TadG
MAKQSSVLSKTRCQLQQKGQGAVEMMFGFLIFFGLFTAIVEFSHLLYAKVTLQHALRMAGRYMVTGSSGMNNGNPIPRDQMIHDMFCNNLIAAGIQCPALDTPKFQFTCVDPAVTPCNGGGPTSTVMVTVRVSKPTLFPFFARFVPGGGLPLQISTTWKNEPFSPST